MVKCFFKFFQSPNFFFFLDYALNKWSLPLLGLCGFAFPQNHFITFLFFCKNFIRKVVFLCSWNADQWQNKLYFFFFFLMWIPCKRPGTKQRNQANISAIRWALAPEKQARQLACMDILGQRVWKCDYLTKEAVGETLAKKEFQKLCLNMSLRKWKYLRWDFCYHSWQWAGQLPAGRWCQDALMEGIHWDSMNHSWSSTVARKKMASLRAGSKSAS